MDILDNGNWVPLNHWGKMLLSSDFCLVKMVSRTGNELFWTVNDFMLTR